MKCAGFSHPIGSHEGMGGVDVRRGSFGRWWRPAEDLRLSDSRLELQERTGVVLLERMGCRLGSSGDYAASCFVHASLVWLLLAACSAEPSSPSAPPQVERPAASPAARPLAQRLGAPASGSEVVPGTTSGSRVEPVQAPGAEQAAWTGFVDLSGWPIDALDTARGVSWLSEVEQDVLLHLNLARHNPPRYAEEAIRPMVERFEGMVYRDPDAPPGVRGTRMEEGVAAVEEALRVLANQPPRPPLRPSRGLTEAARDHRRDQGRTGQIGHGGSDGSRPAERASRHGTWLQTVGENIAYGPEHGETIVVGLIVDDGVPVRGHRKTVFSPEYRVVGVAVGDHPGFGTMAVMVHAGGFEEKTP